MNVLFISECSGAALKETRRILDQFAERRGERTWQTPITMDGLEAVHKLLRKNARKNTAVACHWIRGIDHTELVWIVGSKHAFNSRGAVPTNTTKQKVLRSGDENDWHSLRDVCLIAALAALLHDLGKACDAFQSRLRSKEILERNLYRHEWISLRLFQAFVGRDDDKSWLARLANPSKADDQLWLSGLIKDGLDNTAPKPFLVMPPLAQAVGWLVLTHHRLPKPCDNNQIDQLEQILEQITSQWNEKCDEENREKILPYWQFTGVLPVETELWRQRASRLAERLLSRRSSISNLIDDPFVMHNARLCLMLADHHYSSLESEGRITGQKGYEIYANTDKTGKLKQPLDEHLLGVERLTSQAVYALPKIAKELPRLANCRALRRRSTDESFRWQDRAYDLAQSNRAQAASAGAFIVNMASTGCGKTMANVKVMYALTDPEGGMRCAFALGLRTLTRQTGNEYLRKLNLTDKEVGMLIGGGNVEYLRRLQGERERFEQIDTALNPPETICINGEEFVNSFTAEQSGSESLESLIPFDEEVVFAEEEEYHPSLARLFDSHRAKKLLTAPILVCTIDHLVPATESGRGGHQIAPMLRLLSSDVVLDELDDYDIDDLPALSRLMNWAGMLGSRVLISSATLPPDLVRGMFQAYRAGRLHYQRNRGERPLEIPEICCLWIDEFSCIQQGCADSPSFERMHDQFAQSRTQNLGKKEPLRRSQIIPFQRAEVTETSIFNVMATKIIQNAIELHNCHSGLDPVSQKKISFGLVRMANINPLFDVAMEMYKLGIPDTTVVNNFHIHLCVYHSQLPLFVRSAVEALLDKALNRHQPNEVFDLPQVRSAIDSVVATNQIFIVLSSPIAEVGRDHDYDWAIVEPSSMRSLIQIAGRIRRHRQTICSVPNVRIFNMNVKSLEQCGGIAYRHPGFESKAFKLTTHTLEKLLTAEQRNIIDARPRIVRSAELSFQTSLVDLEHYRLSMLYRSELVTSAEAPTSSVPACLWWERKKATLGVTLQSAQPFRKQSQKDADLVLMPVRHERRLILHEVHEKTGILLAAENKSRSLVNHISGAGIGAWGQVDYLDELTTLAALSKKTLVESAQQFATFSLPIPSNNEAPTPWWRFHPLIGFAKNRPDSYI